MKKKYILLFVVAICFSCNAQKADKIKGNKKVIDVYQSLDTFSALEISNGLEVSLKHGKDDEYHLETDSNLVDQIAFEITGEKLHIYTKRIIQSNRKLKIILNAKSLNSITLNDGAVLKGLNKIETSEMTLITLDNSTYKLDVRTDDLLITMNGTSKGDLAVKGGKLTAILNDNSTLKGDLTLEECELEVNERSDFNMEGDVEELTLTTTGSTKIKASKLRAQEANVIASDNSDISLNTATNLTIYAQGKSTIYVYGNPEMKIDGFKDSSRIIKK